MWGILVMVALVMFLAGCEAGSINNKQWLKLESLRMNHEGLKEVLSSSRRFQDPHDKNGIPPALNSEVLRSRRQMDIADNVSGLMEGVREKADAMQRLQKKMKQFRMSK